MSKDEQGIVRTDFCEEPGEPESKRAFGRLEREARARVGHELLANVGADIAAMALAKREAAAIDVPCHTGPLDELLVVLPIALQEHQV